jgi:hypothetical protein
VTRETAVQTKQGKTDNSKENQHQVLQGEFVLADVHPTIRQQLDSGDGSVKVCGVHDASWMPESDLVRRNVLATWSGACMSMGKTMLQ